MTAVIISDDSDAECMSAVRQLIVNADDFGRSPGINEGIFEAHARGIVTSATVMVLEKGAARGIRQAAERAPELSLGLHFVLTGGGRPASAPSDVPTLAPDGMFRRNLSELPDALPQDEIAAELEEQIALFECMARKPPTHLDSHHHVALHPSVGPVVAAVAKKRSLPVRASSEDARRNLRAAGVRTPDHFVDGFYADGATTETLERHRVRARGRDDRAHVPSGPVGRGAESREHVRRRAGARDRRPLRSGDPQRFWKRAGFALDRLRRGSELREPATIPRTHRCGFSSPTAIRTGAASSRAG